MNDFLKIAFITTFVIEAVVLYFMLLLNLKDNKPTEINWRTWRELGVYNKNKRGAK